MRFVRPTIFLAAAVTCSLIGLTGCASSSTSSAPGFLDKTATNALYQKTVASLTFPPGVTVPKNYPNYDSDPASMTFQSTTGDTSAHYVWQCAWEKQWLNVRGNDAAAAKTALAQLATAQTMDYQKNPARADDVTRRFFKGYLEKAGLGDPSGFQSDVELNCAK